jgi:hypothetical protein
MLTGTANAATIREVVDLATQNANLVRRPKFYDAVLGTEWVPPTEIRNSAPDVNRSEIPNLRKELERFDRRIKTVDDNIAKEQGGGGRENPPGGRDGGGQRAPISPGSGGPRDGGNPRGPGEAEKESPKLQNLRRQLERLKEERRKVVEQLQRLGEVVEGEEPLPLPPEENPTEAKADGALLNSESVRVWVHDVRVQRGRMYRYRMAVWVNNPIFGNSAVLSAQQADLAKPGFVRGEWSDWSRPVKVDDETYFFMTSANEEDDRLNAQPRASAELYSFRWGYWRKGQASLEPGDQLAAMARVPDYSKMIAALLPAPGDSPNAPAGPAGGGRIAQPPAGGDHGNNAGEAPTMVELPMARDAFLLDVAEASIAKDEAGRSRPAQAVIRDIGGEIVIRVPEVDRASDVFLRVSRSSQEGEVAARPRPVAQPGEREPERGPRGPRQPDPESGPGGGGG